MPIDRNTAQYITGNPQQPTQSSAPGIWDIDEQGSSQAAGRWPLPPNVVQRSLRFNSADIAYLSRTPSVTGDRKTYSHSFWIKRGTLGAIRYAFSARQSTTSGNFFYDGLFYSDDTFSVQLRDGSTNEVGNIRTTQVFRDPSAWYHFFVVIDTTQATSSNRMKLYVNGSQVTALGTATYPAQNFDTGANTSGYPFYIGNFVTTSPSSTYNFDGYMAEVNFIDGQALTPSSFGQTDAQTGQWIPRVYSGSYGTNGFRLQFLDNSGTTATTLGKDTSGLGNNWTPNNFSVAAGTGNDSLRDVPMNYYSPDNGLGGEVIGNYCTLNPLASALTGLNNGNLNSGTSGAANWKHCRSTFGLTSGKWYWECLVSGAPDGSNGYQAGVLTDSASLTADPNSASTGFYTRQSTNKYANGTRTDPYFTSTVANDILMFAFDADTGKMWNGKNGVWEVSGNPTAGTGENWSSVPSGVFPMAGIYGSSITITLNFGQRPFAYTAPSGFKALCTQNFSAPRIGNVAVVQANDYFNAVLYTGTGSSLSVTGTGFQPDLVWIKSRSAATDHALYDAVRGVQNQLESNTTTDETTETTGLTAFGSDGFTVGSLAQVNTNTATYVAWQWKESVVSGFDIVTYTGNGANRTIAHNLGVAPSLLIVKARTTASTDQGWPVWHTSIANTNYLLLNSTAGSTSGTTYWNSTSPTSSVFSVGTDAAVNANNDTYVAYLFAAVSGFSAFGSYTGNGSTDGPFVYTGFRPAFILGKRTDVSSIQGWFLFDAVRNTFNQVDLYLSPSGSNSQGTFAFGDMLSNGFKLRSTTVDWNSSGIPYIYAAFAEIPFQFANAR